MDTKTWLLLPLVLAVPSLAPGLVLGRAAPGSRRPALALRWAVALNVLAAPVPWTAYLAFLLIPAACFGIAACVGGIAGRRAWLYGLLAFPWFLVPLLIWWAVTASPDQVASYGRIPVDVLTLSLPYGIVGALAAEAMIFLHSVLWRGRDSD